MLRKTAALLCAFIPAVALFASSYELVSPDGTLKLTLDQNRELTYSLSCDGQVLVSASPVSMSFSDGTSLGEGKVLKVQRSSVDKSFKAAFYRKETVSDKYNSLTLKYKAGTVEFRAYDEGIAWRFSALKKGKAYQVLSEKRSFVFPGDWNIYAAYGKKKDSDGVAALYMDDFENLYSHNPLSGFPEGRLAYSPLMVEAPSGVKMVIAESDVISYPGMFLRSAGNNTLVGDSAPVPSDIEIGGHNGLQQLVASRESFLARCGGEARTFPWRIVCVSRNDWELMENDMVYRLATPCLAQEDFSWVKPGKVAWEWWNNWHVTGVDFKAGVNNPTYKYYIDFAAENGIEYVILDEGWAVKYANDLLKQVPEINVKELVDYGAAKGVGIILWAGYYPFDKDMENVVRTYSEMGVKGFKVDFFNRDDQLVEDFLYRAAEICAKYHCVLDFHGIHKPTGLQRRFPNILNYEGIFGLEMMRATVRDRDMVTCDVTIPYIRFVAGFADYTQGAMLNGTKNTFRTNRIEVMSQGTRCHQLAEYIIFDSPLNMLCDSPMNYRKEPECTAFIASVPTVWDETKAIGGEVAQYSVLARRKGDKWYLGALNNWTERDLEVDLSLFGEGEFNVVAFRDGANADKFANDFIRSESKASGKLRIHLAAGGGYAAVISR